MTVKPVDAPSTTSSSCAEREGVVRRSGQTKDDRQAEPHELTSSTSAS